MDPKNKQARISCDLCRRMKIKCDRQTTGNPCSNCRPRGATCVVTQADRKAGKTNRAKFLHSIESRIQRMEALLQPPATTPSHRPSPPRVNDADASAQSPPVSVDQELANLIINDAGDQKYIGPSSGFSLFAPRGMAWIQRKTNSGRMRGVLNRFQVFGPIWPSRLAHLWDSSQFVRHELPAKEAAIHLVNHFFRYFNATFPLFSHQTFWSLFESHYGENPSSRSSSYGALNVVLAIACVTATDDVRASVRSCDPSLPENLSDLALKLFRNVCCVFMDMTFNNMDLLAIQTLIGMAVVMQSAMNPDTAFIFIGMAARLSSSLGLHRRLEGFGLPKSELEVRRHVFWVLYVIEKDLSIRIGRPSAIEDDDIECPVPTEPTDGDGWITLSGASSGSNKFHPFQSMCHLAMIESKVYKELYASRARISTAAERLESISRLDAELQEWKENFPLEVRPEHPIQCDNDGRFPIVILHYGYYHTMTAIHRVNAHHEIWAAGDDSDTKISHDSPESNPSTGGGGGGDNAMHRGLSSYALCISAARAIAQLSFTYLSDLVDPRNYLIWVAPYFPISAFLTLFTHMLQCPLDPRADGDQALMERTLTCLVGAVKQVDESILKFFCDVLGELVAISREHVKKARSQYSSAFPLQASIGAPPSQSNTMPTQKSQLPQALPSLPTMPADTVSTTLPVSNVTSQYTTPADMLSGPTNAQLPFEDFNYNSMTATSMTATSMTANQMTPNMEGMTDMVSGFDPFYAQFSMTDDPFLLQYGEWDWTT